MILSLGVFVGLAARAAATGVWATPHDAYSSSVGVLGCKINTDRVAYWPMSVDCSNICIKLSYGGRSVNLLRIDQSGGAYDISYDAWNYLQTGQSAAVAPIAGGAVAMDYEEVDASECAGLIFTEGSALPLSGANSMNFLASCLGDSSSWVANNHVLYNICDPICSLGYDEECSLDLATSNQPSCPHTLGLQTPLTCSTPVLNIEYPSGNVVNAVTGDVESFNAEVQSDVSESAGGGGGGAPAPAPAPAAPASPTTTTTTSASTTTPVYASSSTSATNPALFLQLGSSSTTSSTSKTSSAAAVTASTTSSPSATSQWIAYNSTTLMVATGAPTTRVTVVHTATPSPTTMQPVAAGRAGAISVSAVALFAGVVVSSLLGAI